MESAPPDFPATVIVKVSKIGRGHIFDEWASLQFLNQFHSLQTLVPAFYGGDETLELLVLEDLGDVRGRHDLGAILEGDDPDYAREALLVYARHMARLHTTTAVHEEAYQTIRSRFPATHQPVGKDQFEDNFDWFRHMLPQFYFSTSPELEQEIRAIIGRLRDPGAPRAYTRGDVCPSNIAYHDRQMHFYDFEMGGFRNLFLSVAYFRISHLSCINGNLIPLELQGEMETAYFQELSPILPDPAAHQLDYAAAATAMLVWMLSLWLEKKERPRHLATRRQRMFAALTLYSQHEPFIGPYPHTAAVLTRLHQKLDAQWTEEEKTILPFPAFG